MMLKQALAEARGRLSQAGIEDASIEAELLLRHTLGIDRVGLYLGMAKELSSKDEAEFNRLLTRRIQGEPYAYISGRREFYGRDFHVDSRVLIPRPETEMLVEQAIRLAQNGRIAAVADIGTGSGAIAVSLALEVPDITVFATDISPAALEVAGRNCQRYEVTDRICLLQGDLLEPLPSPVDLIIANLPYVKESEIPGSGEPRLALDGGPDGLAQIRRFCRQAPARLNSGGSLLMEIGQGQAGPVLALLREFLPTAHIGVLSDPAGIERVMDVSLSDSPAALDSHPAVL